MRTELIRGSTPPRFACERKLIRASTPRVHDSVHAPSGGGALGDDAWKQNHRTRSARSLTVRALKGGNRPHLDQRLIRNQLRVGWQPSPNPSSFVHGAGASSCRDGLVLSRPWLCAVAVASSALACSRAAAPTAARQAREPPTPAAHRAALAPPEPTAIFGGPPPAHAFFAIETVSATIRCQIDPARVPRAAALVVGLALGKATFRDPYTGEPVRRRYYDALNFFRRVPDELVETGCPLGHGGCDPGYRIPVETSAADRELLARPGSLLLWHYEPPLGRDDPNPPPPGHVIGSDLVVALTDMTHYLGAVTVLGRCGDLDVVRRISNNSSEWPRTPRVEAVRASW
jgi:hypothetical protein